MHQQQQFQLSDLNMLATFTAPAIDKFAQSRQQAVTWSCRMCAASSANNLASGNSRLAPGVIQLIGPRVAEFESSPLVCHLCGQPHCAVTYHTLTKAQTVGMDRAGQCHSRRTHSGTVQSLVLLFIASLHWCTHSFVHRITSSKSSPLMFARVPTRTVHRWFRYGTPDHQHLCHDSHRDGGADCQCIVCSSLLRALFY